MSKESWLWLAGGLGYGAVNSLELLTACPTGPKGVLKELGGIKLDEILTQKQAEKLASTNPEDYALMLNHAEAQGIHVLPINSDYYPKQLHSIKNPPLVLFVKGDLTLLNDQLSVGMVGARKPSGYGVEVMRNLGRGVALGGAIIVSGLAAGLDSEAHKAALAVNGPTIACIAFGHNSCYPAQNKNLMEMIERYGAVVSEYPPNQKPEKAFFLHRNRLIAGLSHALVVAEARRHSGTMSTVNFATDYGRDVFAVPGSVFSELSGGTNAMIREGAYVASCAADIMSLYGIELPEEDLSKLATKQASEGRPQQAASNASTRIASSGASEQTLLEAIQGRISQDKQAEGTRVSRGAAIDAFRRLQEDIPQATLPEFNERNRALEEMVAAVSDDVDIQRKPNTERSAQRLAWEKQLEDPKNKQTDSVRPFSWDGVERLSREELKKSEQMLEKRAQHRVNHLRQPQASSTQRPPAPQAVNTVMPVAPTWPTQPVYAPVRPVHNTHHAPYAPAQPVYIPEQPVQAVPQPVHTAVQTTQPPVPPQPVQATQTGPAAPQSPVDTSPYMVKEVVLGSAQVSAPAEKKPSSSPSGGGLLSSLLTPSQNNNSLSGHLRTRQKPADERAPVQNRKTDGFSPSTPRSTAKVNSAQSVQALAQEPMARAEDDILQNVSETAKKAFAHLGINPRSLSQIAKDSGLSSGEAMAALTELEMAGLSCQLPGRQFALVH